MSNIFDINAPSNTIFLDTKRKGEGIVVLTNTLERKVQGRILIENDNAALKQAITIINPERVFLPKEAQQFTITVNLPETMGGGIHNFRIVALDVDSPDDHYQKGPLFLFVAPPPASAAFASGAILAAIIGLLVVVGAIVGLVFFLLSFEPSTDLNSQIAYTTVLNGQQVIRIHNLRENAETLVLPTPTTFADEHSPAWSPEGQRIAFISNRSGRLVNGVIQAQWSIFIYNVLDERLVRVDDDIVGATALAWSPDGARLAYVRRNTANSYDLIQIEATGDSPQILLSSEQAFQSLSYYPDGRGLTFVHNSSVKFYLFDTNTVSDLLDSTFQRSNLGLVLDATWSPGGDVLALSTIPDTTTRRVASLFRLNFRVADSDSVPTMEDDSLIRLTFGHNDRNPIWSLDGRRIVFISTTRDSEGYLPRPYQILARAEQEEQALNVPDAIAIFQPNLQPRFDQELEPTASPTVTNTPTPTPSVTPTATSAP